MGIWKKIMPYVLHMRPLSWPTFLIHMGVGFAFADGFKMGFNAILIFLAGWFIWVILLNSGTLTFNSYYDKDTGSVMWLNKPPKLPKHLLLFSWILFIFGLVLSHFINFRFFIAYLIFFVLAVMYSHPLIRLKAIPGVDALVNGIGYGSLTVYAGWALADKALNPTGYLLLLAMFFAFMALYPITQFYHYEEDLRRGDKTLTIWIGKKRALSLFFILATISFVLLFYGAIKKYFPHYIFFLIFIYIYLGKLYLGWYSNMNGVDEKKMMYKIAGIALAIDIWLIVSVLI